MRVVFFIYGQDGINVFFFASSFFPLITAASEQLREFRRVRDFSMEAAVDRG